jgi:integrase
MALTEIKIKNTKSKDKPYKLPDGEGLYLLVQPTGSKLWRMKYRFAGKESVLAIGKHPTVSLAEAREQRFEAKRLLKNNINPNAQKKEIKRLSILNSNNSFRAVAQDWHDTHKKKWTPEHATRLWQRLELHAMDQLGSRPIADIKTPELIVLLRRLEKRGNTDTAGRLAQALNVVFRYAVHSGLIEQNPASDLRGVVAPHTETHFAAIRPSELPELFAKLENAETSPQNKLAIKLLIHTFLRPGELRYGRWSEIDWKSKQWNIPAERMKRRISHLVPLSVQALALLEELKVFSGYSDYLFPSQQRRRHPVMSENTINKILRGMGYGGRQVGHGFRAIASTALNESALFRPDVIEAQLSHIEKNNSRRPYNRGEYLEEREQMMQWWGDYLERSSMMISHGQGYAVS